MDCELWCPSLRPTKDANSSLRSLLSWFVCSVSAIYDRQHTAPNRTVWYNGGIGRWGHQFYAMTPTAGMNTFRWSYLDYEQRIRKTSEHRQQRWFTDRPSAFRPNSSLLAPINRAKPSSLLICEGLCENYDQRTRLGMVIEAFSYIRNSSACIRPQ